MSVRIRLSEEDRMAEAKAVIDRRWRFESRNKWGEHVKRLMMWDSQWRMQMPRENKPWNHASKYNPPVTFSKVEDIHAVLFGYFSSFDFFSVSASGGLPIGEDTLRERAQLWTDYLRWSLQQESNAISFIDRFIHDGVLYGHSFGMLPWQRLSRVIRTEVFLPDEFRTPEAEKLADKDLIRVGLGASLIKGPGKEQQDGGFPITFIDDDGEKKDGSAYVDRDNPTRPKGEPVLLIERETVYYNAPRPKSISPWNILVPPTAKDLQTAKCFHVREWMTYNDIARFAKSNLFNLARREDLKNLKDRANAAYGYVGGGSPHSSDFVDWSRDLDLGQSVIEDRKLMFEVWFEYIYEDVDGDGYEESIVRAICQTTGAPPMLLMRQPLEYLYPHGRRPFFDWALVPVDGRYYGMGIPEVLESIQVESNAFYQSRSDVLELVTKPVGFYTPMSGLQPDVIKYTPGSLIKTTDVRNAFAPLVFPVDPSVLLREQALIDGHAEKAVGSTDMGLGRQPSAPNAPRTLGGTAILVRQQQLRMEVYLKRAMYGPGEAGGGICEFLQQYKDLLAAFTPPQKEFRALGSDEVRAIQRSDLAGRFDFVIDLGQEINNPQLRMQNSVLRYQMLITNPLVLQNPQVLWYITKDMMEASGMKNASRVLRPPAADQSHPPLTQEEEFSILGKGIPIDPLPTDDHAAHLQAIQDLLADQFRLSSIFGPAQLPLLGKHAQKHMEMMMNPVPQGAGPSPTPTPGQPMIPPGGNGKQSGPVVTSAQMGGMAQTQQPMAGPIQSAVETGITP